MSKELKVGLTITVVEAILALIVGYILFLAQADSIEKKTVETLAGYFDAIDESMSYDQVMKYLYEDMQNKDIKITQLNHKQISSDNLNQSLIESVQAYADADEYINALALLHSVSNKTPYMDILIKEYEKKYEL